MDLKRVRAKGWMARRAANALMALVMAGGLGTIWVQARTPAAPTPLPGSAVASLARSSLPVQGQQVLQQIHDGGPFRYEKDGTVFGNRERRLPGERRGFYREYTVPTPGLSHRGARRIVCGGMKPRAPDACYYTEDHYTSFRLIVE
jgi:ribonuclease T1